MEKVYILMKDLDNDRVEPVMVYRDEREANEEMMRLATDPNSNVCYMVWESEIK